MLWVAPAISGQRGNDRESGERVPISAYAVAQYSGDEPRAYLFAVSSDHCVLADDLWESPEEAMRVAIDSGLVRNGDWKPNA